MRRFILLLIAALFPLSFLSCASQSKEIRQTGFSGEGMVIIPKGWFMMGSDFGEFNEQPLHEVFVDAFKIDRYEVSAKEFAEFLNHKGNSDNRYFTHNDYSTVIGITLIEGREKETLKDPQKYIPRKGFENFPANNVSWYGAYEYCKWKGKRLPTEAEWEKAARGADFRIYPWGNISPDTAKARYDQSWDEKGLSTMTTVDSLQEGNSPYGALNMAGNVWEWVADWYRLNYCDFCDPAGEDYFKTAAEILGIDKPEIAQTDKYADTPPKFNSAGPLIGSFKVLRGGSWSDTSEWILRNSYRYWLSPSERYNNTGVRCAE
ncbi:MAG: formylglycine-generating enzyme family protein [Nitrospirota bacterium]